MGFGYERLLVVHHYPVHLNQMEHSTMSPKEDSQEEVLQTDGGRPQQATRLITGKDDDMFQLPVIDIIREI
jgi:hypothetical protein